MPIRVMVINDDQDILALYEELLKEEGYDVITSKLAFEHPAAIEMLRPDLVMLDLKFGTRIEGWKMMQKLRLYRPTAKIPMILCTAAVREAREQEEHLRSEGIGIVYKPFAIDHLLLAVRQVLATVEASRSDARHPAGQLIESVSRARGTMPSKPSTSAIND